VSQASVISGRDGRAAVQWVLGGTAGEQTATAAVSNLPPVVFTATAQSGGQLRLILTRQPSSVAQDGVPLAEQPVVRAEDGAGQPVGAGVSVTASVAGATLAGNSTVQSDASGVAQFSDLALSGPTGTYNLTFSAPGFTAVQSAAISLSAGSSGDERGQWTPPFDWPIVAVHMVLLPNGQVLSIGRTGTPQVWDPATNNFTPVPPPAWLFCAGHSLLSDGRVFVAGGHIDDHFGLPNITLFSAPSAWISNAPMVRGRWYPTATTMGNGDVVITAGTDENEQVVLIPEVWSNGSLRQLTGASQKLPWYPRAFLAHDGSLFVAGPTVRTFFLSVSGTGSWKTGPTHLLNESRNYGSAVMYDDGKILYSGGALTTNTAEVIDLNQPTPSWTWTAPMAHARRHHNLTVLPTGEVLATGGVGGTTFNDVKQGVHATELWDPVTGQWTTLASNAVTRGYHGSSLLLPDGRVLNAGGGDGAGAPNERNAEIYSPPYLFRGARPVIASAPTEVRYGDQFRIETPEAAAITNVSFIRLGAVTHAFDQNQRFQRLSFTASANGLTVTAPSSSNRAPPGHYLLFILNSAQVPSVAKIIRIH
jgi:galactose oxidase